MMQLILRPHVVKRTGVVLGLAFALVVAYSMVYNYPIRFRPKWSTKPNSVAALYPSRTVPDTITITPARDTSTSMSFSWRTSEAVPDGVIQYVTDNAASENYEEATAVMTSLTSKELRSDNTIHCFSVTLANLKPATRYRYRVGSKSTGKWSETATFSTAPQKAEPFSFVYIGDTQIKPHRVGSMLEGIEKRHPEAAFYMIGGDLVDMGDLRNLWDDLLARTHSIFSNKPVVPVMGNHDFGDNGFGANIYNAYFNTPNRDSQRPDKVFNYSFRYGDAAFIVMNDMDVKGQSDWLEKALQAAEADGSAFKIVMFHCPVYNPKQHRDNPAAKTYWVPLFDRYKVDLVLSGHDHSYMRTKPLRAGNAVENGQTGTTYVVATGCDKFYKFEKLDIADRQFTNEATYQLISISTEADGRRLAYTAYNRNGKIRDSFVLPSEKGKQ
ncbi:MAG: metallophosphoesterase family protein [Planctomycetaceae bacterium]|nr:metallophosphoesterase family protein [Planctomycetaceae bacterium]